MAASRPLSIDGEGGGEEARDDSPSHVSPLTYHVLAYPSGASYKGYINDQGLREGHGLYIDKNGNKYEGGWKNDKASGYGCKRFKKTGDVHEGYYENDKRENFGVYLWSNTDKYIGNWSNGVMHGQGTFMWSRGDVYQGQWVNGKMQ